MRSTLVSRNVTILGRRTSLRLEIELWEAIEEICEREGLSLHELCSLIEPVRMKGTSRTSAIRAFTILYYKIASRTAPGDRVVVPGILPVNTAAE